MNTMFVQEDPNQRSKRALAESMMQSGRDASPVQHPMQAWGRLAQALVGKKMNDRLDAEEKTRQQSMIDTFNSALNPEPWSNPDGGEFEYKPSYESLAKALSGNPDTAPMALQFQLKAMEKANQPRKTAKDAMGRSRYVDDGSFVFDDMKDYDKNVLSDAAVAQKARIAAAGKSSTNVNLNTGAKYPGLSKLGEGMAYRYNPDGTLKMNEQGVPEAVAIPGTKPAIEAQKRADAAVKKKAMDARNSGVVIEDIDRAIGVMDEDGLVGSTGLTGAALTNIPGTDAHKLGKLLQTVKANAGFDRLQQMRDASPTGGALGQVSERELGYLQAAIGNLEQSQDEETLKHNLERVRRIYQDIIHGPAKPSTNTDNDPLGIR